MRNIFVDTFLLIVAVAFCVWLFQRMLRSAAHSSEQAFEWFRKRSAAARLKRMAQSESKAELVDLALALVLAEYHWPKRLPDDDKVVASASSRHRANLQSMSLQELKEWIDDHISESHSVFLNTAAESLDLNKTDTNAHSTK